MFFYEFGFRSIKNNLAYSTIAKGSKGKVVERDFSCSTTEVVGECNKSGDINNKKWQNLLSKWWSYYKSCQTNHRSGDLVFKCLLLQNWLLIRLSNQKLFMNRVYCEQEK